MVIHLPYGINIWSMLHTENVAKGGQTEFPKCKGGMWLWGGKLSFQNVRGGKGAYEVLTFKKSRGGAREGGQRCI